MECENHQQPKFAVPSQRSNVT